MTPKFIPGPTPVLRNALVVGRLLVTDKAARAGGIIYPVPVEIPVASYRRETAYERQTGRTICLGLKLWVHGELTRLWMLDGDAVDGADLHAVLKRYGVKDVVAA